jgi:hypothetical protein
MVADDFEQGVDGVCTTNVQHINSLTLFQCGLLACAMKIDAELMQRQMRVGFSSAGVPGSFGVPGCGWLFSGERLRRNPPHQRDSLHSTVEVSAQRSGHCISFRRRRIPRKSELALW